MKLLRLDLLAVGPFTGVMLDLSAGTEGLHVVVGPNEAGKSSALRAVAALLFGFGARTAGEDAVHKTTDVRVGGLLRHSDGSELAIVRRRGTARTLLDGADGKTPLRDDALSRFLGTVDRATFDGFFGLGHESLRAGGEDLLRTDGQVGQALFSAGAGGKPLRVALERYVQQADALYIPKGKIQELPKALAEFEAAGKAVKVASLPPEEWTAERRNHDEAQAEAEAARAEWAKVSAERSRLDRLRRAIPLLVERAGLRAELSAVADAPLLPADFATRRAKAEQAAVNHARTLADARRRLDGVNAELAGVVVPEPLLDQTEAVDDLYSRLKGYRQAVAAMPALRVKLDAAVATVARIVLDLRPDQPVPASGEAAITAADGLRLGTARRQRIGELAAAYERLTERQASVRRAVADVETARRRQAAELASLPPSVDVSALDGAVRAATRAGDLDKELAVARAAAAREASRSDTALRGLPLVTGSLADVVALPVPSTASVDAAARDLATLDADHAKADADAVRLRRQLSDLDHQLAALQLAGHVPTEAELATTRAERDALWAGHAAAGVIGDPRPYESAVRRADATADALRRESTRVAQQARLTFERDAVDQALAAATVALATADAVRTAAGNRWRQLWAATGIDPLPPVEMRAWLSRHADLCRIAAAAGDAAAVAISASAHQAAHHRAVSAALGGTPAEGPLSPLLERARGVIDSAKAADERRRRIDAQLRDGAVDAERRAAEASAVEAELSAWQAEWASAVTVLGLPREAGPGEARSLVQRCDDLSKAADEARRLLGDLATAEADVRRFTTDAAALAAVVGIGGSATPDATAAQLRQAVEAAQQGATRRAALRKQRAAAAAALVDAESAASAAHADLAELFRIAGCEPDTLPEVERRSAERRDLEARVKQKERELLTLNHGEPIETLAAEAATVDEPTLEIRLADLVTQGAALEERRRELDQRIGRATAKLEGWTGGDAAADAANAAEAVLARARDTAARYVRLRLASGVLRQGIERHRQRKQAPLLRRASELFTSLTLGSFASLDVGFAADDQPVLIGVRGDGRRATVDQMSDGTRDQLYLSLRLAGLEDFVVRNEPVPLVVDDVLVHFDDRRSSAALAALAELSRRTQVILFTHHDRVADLAREAAVTVAVVHRLGAA
jgi:uncharacterized protein YhaN